MATLPEPPIAALELDVDGNDIVHVSGVVAFNTYSEHGESTTVPGPSLSGECHGEKFSWSVRNFNFVGEGTSTHHTTSRRSALRVGESVAQNIFSHIASSNDGSSLDALHRDNVAAVQSHAVATAQSYVTSKNFFRIWRNGNVIYIAFRGTDNIENVLTDISCDQVLFDFTEFSYCTGPEPQQGVYVHRGFVAAYLALRQQLRNLLQSMSDTDSITTIVCTGHSLGGALAAIAAVDFGILKPQESNCGWWNRDVTSKLKIKCYTFGSPHVGDAGFGALFASSVSEAIRYINYFDIVPMLLGMANWTRKNVDITMVKKFWKVPFCHTPIDACVLGGACRAAASVVEAIMKSGDVMDKFKSLGLGPVDQHKTHSYAAGILSHLGHWSHEIILLNNKLVSRFLSNEKVIEKVVDVGGQLLRNNGLSMPSGVATLHGISSQGDTGNSVGNAAASNLLGECITPYLAGADLLVNVVGHIATNVQLYKLSGKLDRTVAVLEGVHSDVTAMTESIDTMSASLADVNMLIRNSSAKVDETLSVVNATHDIVSRGFRDMSAEFNEIKDHLASVSVSIANLPAQFEELQDIQEIKRLQHEVTAVFMNVFERVHRAEAIEAALDRIDPMLLSTSHVARKYLTSPGSSASVEVALCALISLCEASILRLYLSTLIRELFVPGGLQRRLANIRYTVGELVGRWIVQCGLVSRRLDVERLGSLYGRLFDVDIDASGAVTLCLDTPMDIAREITYNNGSYYMALSLSCCGSSASTSTHHLLGNSINGDSNEVVAISSTRQSEHDSSIVEFVAYLTYCEGGPGDEFQPLWDKLADNERENVVRFILEQCTSGQILKAFETLVALNLRPIISSVAAKEVEAMTRFMVKYLCSDEVTCPGTQHLLNFFEGEDINTLCRTIARLSDTSLCEWCLVSLLHLYEFCCLDSASHPGGVARLEHMFTTIMLCIDNDDFIERILTHINNSDEVSREYKRIMDSIYANLESSWSAGVDGLIQSPDNDVYSIFVAGAKWRHPAFTAGAAFLFQYGVPPEIAKDQVLAAQLFNRAAATLTVGTGFDLYWHGLLAYNEKGGMRRHEAHQSWVAAGMFFHQHSAALLRVLGSEFDSGAEAILVNRAVYIPSLGVTELSAMARRNVDVRTLNSWVSSGIVERIITVMAELNSQINSPDSVSNANNMLPLLLKIFETTLPAQAKIPQDTIKRLLNTLGLCLNAGNSVADRLTALAIISDVADNESITGSHSISLWKAVFPLLDVPGVDASLVLWALANVVGPQSLDAEDTRLVGAVITSYLRPGHVPTGISAMAVLHTMHVETLHNLCCSNYDDGSLFDLWLNYLDAVPAAPFTDEASTSADQELFNRVLCYGSAQLSKKADAVLFARGRKGSNSASKARNMCRCAI